MSSDDASKNFANFVVLALGETVAHELSKEQIEKIDRKITKSLVLSDEHFNFSKEIDHVHCKAPNIHAAAKFISEHLPIELECTLFVLDDSSESGLGTSYVNILQNLDILYENADGHLYITTEKGELVVILKMAMWVSAVRDLGFFSEASKG